MKKIIYIMIILIILSSCSINNNSINTLKDDQSTRSTVETATKVIPNYNNGKAEIKQIHLEKANILKPTSLIEISNNLTDFDRNKISSINIQNGENIISLEGIELFPILECLYIFNSNIQNINGIKKRTYVLRDLIIESKELLDITDIVLFTNLDSLYLIGSEKLEIFPNIKNLSKLKILSLNNSKKININDLYLNLPSEIKILYLSGCNIKSLNDISNLFLCNITHFDLSNNLIDIIDLNMNFGVATYIYLARNPIEESYFKYDQPISEEYPGYIINNAGVYFAFGYMEDYMWVIE